MSKPSAATRGSRWLRLPYLADSRTERNQGRHRVLVFYHDRMKKFMDKWGAAAQTEMWKEEHEAEVGAFCRCTCHNPAQNL